MKKRAYPKYDYSTDSISGRREYIWLYVMITLIAAAILALGFFLAARQHFSAMELSFRNSALRQQLSDLEAEQRRLTLAREIARSPAEIKRAAARIGFREVTPEIAMVASRENITNGTRSLVAKTSMTRPVTNSGSTQPSKSSPAAPQSSGGNGKSPAGNTSGRNAVAAIDGRPRTVGTDRLASIR